MAQKKAIIADGLVALLDYWSYIQFRIEILRYHCIQSRFRSLRLHQDALVSRLEVCLLLVPDIDGGADELLIIVIFVVRDLHSAVICGAVAIAFRLIHAT